MLRLRERLTCYIFCNIMKTADIKYDDRTSVVHDRGLVLKASLVFLFVKSNWCLLILVYVCDYQFFSL